jgi:hypothetical protein
MTDNFSLAQLAQMQEDIDQATTKFEAGTDDYQAAIVAAMATA